MSGCRDGEDAEDGGEEGGGQSIGDAIISFMEGENRENSRDERRNC